jgi:hypothetical protein
MRPDQWKCQLQLSLLCLFEVFKQGVDKKLSPGNARCHFSVWHCRTRNAVAVLSQPQLISCESIFFSNAFSGCPPCFLPEIDEVFASEVRVEGYIFEASVLYDLFHLKMQPLVTSAQVAVVLIDALLLVSQPRFQSQFPVEFLGDLFDHYPPTGL